MTHQVVIAGGGIAGLATAWNIREQARAQSMDVEITVLEASDHIGGKIQSTREDGYLCESGANAFVDNEPATRRLIESLGIEEQLVRSHPGARRRFILRGGELMELSMNPARFLKSNLLSRKAKWRLALELFLPRRKKDEDESVADFGRRRLGKEFTEVMLDSMVSGIYAGDPERLSLRAAFPAVARLEEEHGGLIKGVLARRKSRKKKTGGPVLTGALHSFVDGMAVPAQALAEQLGERIVRTGAPLRSITREGYLWRLELASGRTLEADAIVFATPPAASAGALRNAIPDAARALEGIPLAGIHVVCAGFARSQLESEIEGFGVLIPRNEGVRTLGVLFSSSTFSERAPDGRVLLTCLIGGRCDEEANELDDQELTKTVLDEVMPLLRITGDPQYVHVQRWARGIPQYELGHLDRVKTARDAAEEAGGVFLTGNGLSGIGFNQCVAESETIAEETLDYLKQSALQGV